MRIWSIHPKYLDTKGLVALWIETLLAKNVLEGNTKGYKNHPQLNRFKKTKSPIDAINQYLSEVYQEAKNRNFNFDKNKINWVFKKAKIPVTTGQMNYEIKHLLMKLEKRDFEKFQEIKSISIFDSHPIFNLIEGEIEEWEKLIEMKKVTFL